MQIKFECPAGHRLHARAKKAGTRVTCPACGAEVLVPEVHERPLAAPQQSAPAASQPSHLSPESPISNSGLVVPSSSESTVLASPSASAEQPLIAPERPTAESSAAATANATARAAALTKRPAQAPSTRREAGSGGTGSGSGSDSGAGASSSGSAVGSGSKSGSSTGSGASRRRSGPPPLPQVRPDDGPVSPLRERWAAEAAALAQGRTKSATGKGPPPLPAAGAIEPTAHRAGYQPDRTQVRAVHRLGLVMALVTLLQIVPAVRHVSFVGAPLWAQLLLVMSGLQLAYVVWTVTMPDWSTVLTSMLVYAAVAAVFGGVLVAGLLTSPGQEMIFGLGELRWPAIGWSAVLMLLALLAAGGCGRLGLAWHRSYWAAAR